MMMLALWWAELQRLYRLIDNPLAIMTATSHRPPPRKIYVTLKRVGGAHVIILSPETWQVGRCAYNLAFNVFVTHRVGGCYLIYDNKIEVGLRLTHIQEVTSRRVCFVFIVRQWHMKVRISGELEPGSPDTRQDGLTAQLSEILWLEREREPSR